MKITITTIAIGGLIYATLVCALAAVSGPVSVNPYVDKSKETSRLGCDYNLGGGNSKRLYGPARYAQTTNGNGRSFEDFDRTEIMALILKDQLSKGAPNRIVVWTSSWCSACKAQKPIIEKLRKEGYSIEFVDFDTNQPLARQLGITKLPTSLVYADNKLVKRFVGVTPGAEIKKYLKLNNDSDYIIW